MLIHVTHEKRRLRVGKGLVPGHQPVHHLLVLPAQARWLVGLWFPFCGYPGLAWSWVAWGTGFPLAQELLCLLADTDFVAFFPSPCSRQPPTMGLFWGFQPGMCCTGCYHLTGGEGLLKSARDACQGPHIWFPWQRACLPKNKSRSLDIVGFVFREGLGTRPSIALDALGRVPFPFWVSVFLICMLGAVRSPARAAL